MTERRQILVLANSAKQGGRCLAGRFVERNAGGRWAVADWCRPVLPDGDGHDAIPAAACDRCSPLDIIGIELDGPLPVAGQPENWRWAPDPAITLEATLNQTENALVSIAETPIDLWLDPGAVRPDEVGAAHQVDRSLHLIQAQDLWLHLFHDTVGRRKIHAEFRYNGHVYEQIPVTDPVIARILSRQFPDVGQRIRMQLNHGDNYWMTVSLGLPFGPRNVRYKFVAAIIDHTGYLQRTFR